MELLRLVGVSPNIDSPSAHPAVVGLLGPYPDPKVIPTGLVLNTIAWESDEAAGEGDYVLTVAQAVRLVARHTEFRLAPTRTTTKSFEAACMALLQSGVDILLVTYGPATAQSQDGMRRIVEAANASGTIVVWSAANDPQAGERVPQEIADDFLFVSSVDFGGARAKFSSEVPSSVWAPGVEIVLAMQGRLQSRSGNTYSAAVAAGLVARTVQAGVPLSNVVSYLREHGEARNGGPPVLNLAQAVESFNAPDKNRKLSSLAILEQLREFGDRYQSVRRTMKGGSARTAVMNETVNDIATWAASAGVLESHLKTILKSGKDGERLAVLACCVSVPDQAPVSAIRSALERPKAPFEQWTALLAARAWLNWVELGDADPLLTGILQALDTPANIINDEGDESRKALAETVLIEFSRRIGFVWTWLDAQARRELELWLELGSERNPEHGCVAIWGSDHSGHHRDLAVALGRRLTSHGWRVVMGLGPNVGAAIFEGARLEGFEDCVTVYSDRDSGEAGASVQVCSSLEGARQKILEHASCAIVIAGASGTRHEYELAAGSGLTVVPLPFTGGTAAAVAEQALAPMKAFQPALIGLLDLPNGDAAERITRVLNFATRNQARASVAIAFDSYCLRRGEDSETYDWCVFIASPKELVQTVQSVDYTLHPTFRVREVSVTETQNRFCLVSSGWGSFTLGITLNFKDGTRQMASYLLRLRSNQWPLAARSTLPAGSPEALMLSVMEDASKHRWRKASTLAKKARLSEEEALERLQKLQRFGACRPANFDIGGEQTLWGATSVVGLLPSL